MGSRPSKVVFLLSFIIGVFAILNEFWLKLNIPVLSDIGNFILLTVAFLLLLAGVIFKGL
jgi:hypothetical protein